MLRALGVLIVYPLLALAPAILFLGLFAITRRRLTLAAGIVWFAYVPYEYAMKLRILCSGECNIRVDLLLLYPLLVALSVAALVVFIGWTRRPRHR